ncbi:MAG: hypothetical protein ABW175_25335, partial [Bradyrhizobium sp.]
MSSIVVSTDEKADGRSRQWSFSGSGWRRAVIFAQALVLPVVLLVLWHFMTAGRPASLIPPPLEVWLELRDLAVGGINDDAYSGTLLTHLVASVSRVFGGFGLALVVALPLGMLIGRIELVRRFVEPLLQILRPVPVTAWLPLAMIIFGLGP